MFCLLAHAFLTPRRVCQRICMHQRIHVHQRILKHMSMYPDTRVAQTIFSNSSFLFFPSIFYIFMEGSKHMDLKIAKVSPSISNRDPSPEAYVQAPIEEEA